jgi:hypothetical protein
MDAVLKTTGGDLIAQGFGFMLSQPAAQAEVTLPGGSDRWGSVKYFEEYILEVKDGKELRCFVTRMIAIVIGGKQLVTL